MEENTPTRKWIGAGLRAAFIFGVVAAIPLLGLPHPRIIGAACLTFLALPAGLLLVPFMRNIHDADLGLMTVAILINWILYTALLRWLLRNRT